MATQRAWPETAGTPSETLKGVADVVRTTSERAVAGQREVVDFAIQQAKENTDDLFTAMLGMAVAANSVDAASCYMRFLNEAARKQAQHMKSFGDIMTRSGKAAWPPVFGEPATSMPKPSVTPAAV